MKENNNPNLFMKPSCNALVKLLLLFSIAAIASSCQTPHLGIDSSVSPSLHTYNLTWSERTALKKRVEKGDADAAFRLAGYYRYAKDNLANYVYWLREASKRGHIIAQYNLSNLLLNKQEKFFDLTEAEHWISILSANENICKDVTKEDIDYLREKYAKAKEPQ